MRLRLSKYSSRGPCNFPPDALSGEAGDEGENMLKAGRSVSAVGLLSLLLPVKNLRDIRDIYNPLDSLSWFGMFVCFVCLFQWDLSQQNADLDAVNAQDLCATATTKGTVLDPPFSSTSQMRMIHKS